MTKTPTLQATAAGAIMLAAVGCSKPPSTCLGDADFANVTNYTFRERNIKLTPTYDVLDVEDNCTLATYRRDMFTLRKHTRIKDAHNNLIGRTITPIFQMGYDTDIKDEQGATTHSVDHRIIRSALNLNGYVMDVKDVHGQTIGTLRQDPIALFSRQVPSYFEIKDETGDVLVEITRTFHLNDTYQVTNNDPDKLPNKVVGSLVSLLDQIKDEQEEKTTRRNRNRRNN